MSHRRPQMLGRFCVRPQVCCLPGCPGCVHQDRVRVPCPLGQRGPQALVGAGVHIQPSQRPCGPVRSGWQRQGIGDHLPSQVVAEVHKSVGTDQQPTAETLLEPIGIGPRAVGEHEVGVGGRPEHGHRVEDGPTRRCESRGPAPAPRRADQRGRRSVPAASSSPMKKAFPGPVEQHVDVDCGADLPNPLLDS